MDVLKLREYEKLSPFQIKDELIKLAGKEARKTAHAFLNAGRGNPNWVATRPRAAFFLLGQFALTESTRVMNLAVGLGGKPEVAGIAQRLDEWLTENRSAPGADILEELVQYAIETFQFDADAFVHELVDSVIGDNYPVPDRALEHTERVVHAYLMWAMGVDENRVEGFDLFPVEGGTAAMCYVFKCLKANRLLNPGDTIALGTPIFSPYLEMPELEDYALKTVRVDAEESEGFQITEEHFARLLDPAVKAFFLVNPGNPTSVALNETTIGRLVELVRDHRSDLMILTDDVYGTFVRGFHSLMGQLPRNTIGVYSYSKYFGCTGWRLGVIAVHKSNVYDQAIAAHPAEIKVALNRRYGALALNPEEIRFIDRIVADSRDVALNHTAGLSLPQQAMMTLFSLAELVDSQKSTKTLASRSCRNGSTRSRTRWTSRSTRVRTTTPITGSSILSSGCANMWARTSSTGSRPTSTLWILRSRSPRTTESCCSTAAVSTRPTGRHGFRSPISPMRLTNGSAGLSGPWRADTCRPTGRRPDVPCKPERSSAIGFATLRM